MNRNILLIFLIFIFCFKIGAQGRVIFNEPVFVKNAFDSYISKNQAEKTLKAWRIQIISTDDRREMDNVKSKFSLLYPGLPSVWKHVSPYYHVRVGAFRTKTEMMSLLTVIKKDFPAAIPVQDDIPKYDLISY